MMRVLTVRQPWAHAIIRGGKDVENRVRNVGGDYRGPVAIHAALKTADLSSEQRALLEQVDGLGDWFGGDSIVGGAIIGVVDLVDVHHFAECVYVGSVVEDFDGNFVSQEVSACSVWAEQGEVHHLVLANRRPLGEPIPFRGALGLRTLPDDVEAAVWAGMEF